MQMNPIADDGQASILRALADSVSRRTFLGRGLAAAAVPAALAAVAPSAEAATKDAPFGLIPTLYTGWTKRNFAEIRADENAHVAIIKFAISSLGGTPRPKPTFQNLTAPSASAFTNASATFENLGVQAYFGAAPAIFNPNVFAVAASIAFVEAYHSGFLNTLLNRPIVPNGATYVSAATISQVVSAATPYIASLNDNGLFPPTFSSTPSAINDIAILNFALLLEYLEAEFYNINVSRILPGT